MLPSLLCVFETYTPFLFPLLIWYYSYIFVFVYGCGVDVAGIVFYAEIYPNHLRPKGLAITVASTCLSSLIYLQVAATAFTNIGWKFYLVRLIKK